MDVSGQKIGERETWFGLPRRRFLQAMMGILGGIALPVWAKRDKATAYSTLREAEFYRAKEETERR